MLRDRSPVPATAARRALVATGGAARRGAGAPARWGFLVAAAAVLLPACRAPAPAPTLISVRDAASELPVAGAVLTVTPNGGLLADGSPEATRRANDYGAAAFELVGRGAKYFVIVDAPGYDLQTLELPAFTPLFPSGEWLETQSGRVHALRADRRVQVMVSRNPDADAE